MQPTPPRPFPGNSPAGTSELGSGQDGAGQRDTWRDTLRFLRLLLPYRSKLLLAALIVVVSALFKFTIPLAIMYVLDQLTARRAVEHFPLIFAILSGIVLAAYGLKLLMRYLLSVIQERVFLRVQMQLFEHIHRLPLAFLESSDTGYLMARVRNDIMAAQGLLADKIIHLAISIVTFCAGLVLCFSFHVRMSLFALAVLPFYVAATVLPSGRLQGMARNIQERSAEVFRVLQEALSAISLTRLFGRERWQARRFHHAVAGEIRAKISLALFGGSIGQLADLITNLGTIALLAYGTLAVVRQELSIGQLMAFLSFYGFLLTSISNVIGLNVDYQQSVAAVGRIFSVLELAAEGGHDSRPATALPAAGPKPSPSVTLSGVSFAYNERNSALREVDLELKAGEVIALVGRSGAGKSTLAKLLPRLLKPTRGAIRINGTAIEDWPLAELRRTVSMVTHTPVLLGGTIAENITLGRSAPLDTVMAAAKLARAHDFVSALPLGLATQLGRNGINLSVGQAQRIALARLIFHDPQILIIDEGLSGVDGMTEVQILEDLAGAWRQGIVLLISHRLATVQRASRIVLLDEGKVLRVGTHPDLMESSPLYRDLCQKQLLQERSEKIHRYSLSESQTMAV